MKKAWFGVMFGALVFGAAACGDSAGSGDEIEEVDIQFQALVDGEPFDCAASYQLGTAATEAQFTDLRFYLSEVSMVEPDGTEVPVELIADDVWQDDQVALLDFEDGSGACDNGNADINTVVKGRVPAGDYTGLRFTLGVPFEANHQNAAAAGSPLNITSMFWNWQGGYKFLRVDGRAAGSAGFRVHLGSTACESAEGSNDVSGCANENRPRVELAEFDPGEDAVAFDAAALFSDVDMTPNQEGKSAVCMSAPDHTVCKQIFPKMGLPFADAPAGDIDVFGVTGR
ncbi:MAG: MbnP family copper-binding protein [Myxococcota bacterium]